MELLDAYKKYDLTLNDFKSSKYFRIRTIESLITSGKMDKNLFLKREALYDRRRTDYPA